MTTLVIGYGNTLRGDDGAGPRVAEAVARWGRPGVVVEVVHQLIPELAARIAEVNRVIFVDARLAASPSETYNIHSVDGDAGWAGAGHACDPRALLALAERAFERRPEAWSVTLPALDLDFGEHLSATTRREMCRALPRIAALLAAPIRETPTGAAPPWTRPSTRIRP